MKRCVDCIFSFNVESELECRRFPPKIIYGEEYIELVVSLFPNVRENDLCGEFKPLLNQDS